MQTPISYNENSSWDINLLLNQEDDVKFEYHDIEDVKHKEITPELDDDVFNEVHSALSIELF